MRVVAAVGLQIVFLALYLGSLALIVPAIIVFGMPIDEQVADLIQLSIAWPLTICIGLKVYGHWFTNRPTRPFDVALLPPLLAGSVGALILLLALIGVLGIAVSALFGVSAEDLPAQPTSINPLVTFASAVVLAPLAEEVFYRGLLLYGLMGRYSARKAIWISAILFAVGHLSPGQALLALPLGLAYGWLTVTTKSLWPAIVSHASVNAGLSFVLQPLLRNVYGVELDAWPLRIPATLIAPAAVVALISVWYIHRRVGHESAASVMAP